MSETKQKLLAEIEELRLRLQDAEETLEAIRTGGVDALVVSGPEERADIYAFRSRSAYRILFETMNEGAATLATDGTILFCNNRFSVMLKKPMESILGGSLLRFVSAEDIPLVEGLLKRGLEEPQNIEIALKSDDGNLVQCHVSTSALLY